KRIAGLLDMLTKHNIVVRVSTILTKKNIDELDMFYKTAKNLDLNEWFFLRPVYNKKQLISKEDMQTAIRKILRYNKEYGRGCFIANSVPFCIFEPEEMGLADAVVVGGRNDSGNTRLVVSSDGSIKTDYYSKMVLGNAFEDSLSDVWKHFNGYPVPKGCAQCNYLAKCLSGISIWNHEGLYSTNDPLLKGKI
ncbi:MAG: hypothetical protein KJ601_02705, partial [Nanoarchaeota archaeon]|nr:hypothetical protein [Nanoarchaeota archaeon]